MRASLSAVHAAVAETRARNRRETTKARLLVAAAVVTFAVGLGAVRTRAAHRALRGVSSGAVPRSAQTAPISATSQPGAPVIAARAPAAPEIAAPDTTANDSAIAECEVLSQHHRWRQAAEPCAIAIKARPNDATILLGLAQSAHARNRLAEAGAWAKRASALDPSLAEAFIIQAHAETLAGDENAADRDFRRYLALAPRGWHAKEALKALRAHPASS